jgi:hypothetical protein
MPLKMNPVVMLLHYLHKNGFNLQMQILLKNRTKEKLKNVNPNLLKGTSEQ